MAYKAKRTEHAGAKNGHGYWGHRVDAKKESNKVRRENDKKEGANDTTQRNTTTRKQG